MKNVLLIDSGSGGVNVLKECVKVCPYCNYLLFCDSKNLPYGEKSNNDLIDITIDNLKKIKEYFNYDIVVLACNTLTAVAIDRVREEFREITFIGTVPAIKPALTEFSEEDVLVIATPSTIKNNLLLKRYPKVKRLALPTLAQMIDENLDDLDSLDQFIKKSITADFKAIVLGCTHYFSLRSNFERLFNVKVFDSANGVARRLLSFVDEWEINYKISIFSNRQQDIAKFWWFYQNGV